MTKLDNFIAFVIAFIITVLAVLLLWCTVTFICGADQRAPTQDRTVTRLAEVIANQQAQLTETERELSQLRRESTEVITGLLREIDRLEKRPATKPTNALNAEL